MSEEKKMNVCVWDVRFYMNDDDGNELIDKDGNVRVFTAPALDFVTYAYDMVEYDDLEEVK